MIAYRNIKIDGPLNIDESNSRHIRVGYHIESKPSYAEKKLAKVTAFFHW